MSLTLSCLVLISQTASAQPHTGIHVAPAHAPVPPAVAAASTPPVDLCYRFDDRVAETAVGATPGNSFDSLNINAFQAPAGGDTITTLELQTFGGYTGNDYTGGPITWLIYEDPTDDFDPSDAVLVWSTPDVAVPRQVNDGVFQSVAVPNISVDGIWWAGVVYHGLVGGEFPAGFSQEVPSFGRAWEATATPGTINLTSLPSNGYFADIAAGCCDGVWHIRAEGTQCIDLPNCYGYDTGVADASFGFECGSTASLDWMMLNAYEAENGTDILLELSAQFGDPASGSGGYDPSAAIEWAIWNDPNDDGDPIDAELLWSATDTVGSALDSGAFKTIAVPEITVNGTFFVGILFDENLDVGGGRPMSLDTSVPFAGSSWVGYQNSGACDREIDLSDLSTVNGLHPTSTTTAFWSTPGNWMIRARSWTCDCGDPIRYCESAPNSVSALGARIFTNQSISIAANDLVISAIDVPPLQNAIIVSASDKIQLPLSDGFLCVVGTPIYRLEVLQSDASGRLDYSFDQTFLLPGYTVAPGQTWNFQYWYRDTIGSGANLSNAVAVTFCP
ncbi:MAG: hypothetical protein AAFU73_06820 [Planctomycetota bacterium]